MANYFGAECSACGKTFHENDDIVVLAGKGEDPYQKINGEDVPYPTDVKIARDYINELEISTEKEQKTITI